MDLPPEGRISGPSTGFEVTVPGRQGIAPCATQSRLRERRPPLRPPSAVFPSSALPCSFSWCRGKPRALLTCREDDGACGNMTPGDETTPSAGTEVGESQP